jgi:hypothetical protein
VKRIVRSNVGRKIKLKVRVGVALYWPGRTYGAGDELVLPAAEAAKLLKDKGIRRFEIVEVIDDDTDRRRGPKLP